MKQIEGDDITEACRGTPTDLTEIYDFHFVNISTNECVNDKRSSSKNVCKINNKGDAEPMYVDVVVNGKRLKLEVDTGTYVTVISNEDYSRYFSKFTLTKTTSDLNLWGRCPMKPIGKLTNLTVAFNNIVRILELFVLPGSGPALIVRQWLNQFGLWPLTF